MLSWGRGEVVVGNSLAIGSIIEAKVELLSGAVIAVEAHSDPNGVTTSLLSDRFKVANERGSDSFPSITIKNPKIADLRNRAASEEGVLRFEE